MDKSTKSRGIAFPLIKVTDFFSHSQVPDTVKSLIHYEVLSLPEHKLAGSTEAQLEHLLAVYPQKIYF